MMTTMVERIREILLGENRPHMKQHGETSRLVEESCRTVEGVRQERELLQADLQRYHNADVARTLLLARDRNES